MGTSSHNLTNHNRYHYHHQTLQSGFFVVCQDACWTTVKGLILHRLLNFPIFQARKMKNNRPGCSYARHMSPLKLLALILSRCHWKTPCVGWSPGASTEGAPANRRGRTTGIPVGRGVLEAAGRPSELPVSRLPATGVPLLSLSVSSLR